MEPLEAPRLPAWRQVVVAGILAALAGALIWQVSRDPVPLPPTGTVASISPASIAGVDGVNPITETSTVSSIASAMSTATATSNTTVTPIAAVTSLPEPPSDAEVLAAADAALAAWGRFAISGDLTLLEPFFDPSGPQYRRLVSESEALQSDPLGEPPYTVVLGPAQITADDDGRPAIEGPVTFLRAGEVSQTFLWRMVFTQVGEGWALWSVQPV